MQSRLTVPANPGNTATVREVFGVFLRLGFTAFGGPAVHIAMMERETVEQRGWLTRAAFLDALGVVQALPGPNSTELAIHLGHLRAGWRGGLAGGVAFIAPAVAMVWILSAVATMRVVQPIAAGVLWWVTPVLVAILLDSLWRFGAQAWSRGAAAIVLPVTAAAAFLVSSEVGVLAIGAGAALLARRMAASPPGNGATLAAVLAIGIPAALLAAARAPATVLPPGTWALGGYFLRAGVSVFGSGYVLLSYLQTDLVAERGWLPMSALLQSATFAQLTPGPLFATATGAGYVIGGHAGAAAATIGVFAPAFALAWLAGPIGRVVAGSPVARTVLDGLVIAGVALLGRAVVGFGWSLGPWQWAIVALALGLVFSRRVSTAMLLLVTVAVGIVTSIPRSFPG